MVIKNKVIGTILGKLNRTCLPGKEMIKGGYGIKSAVRRWSSVVYEKHKSYIVI